MAYRLKDWKQETWERDIDSYARIAKLVAGWKSPESKQRGEQMLADRRQEMVKRYGETAMKGL